MSQITGKATIKLDGEELLTDVSVTFNPGGVEREAVMGPRGVQGHRETPVASSLQATVRHTQATNIIALGNITGATVLIETDTGDTYMMRKAFTTEPVELTTGEGNVSLNMSSYKTERI